MDVREIPGVKRLATLKFLTACRTAVLAQMADLGTEARYAEKRSAQKPDVLRDGLNIHLGELNGHIARFRSSNANCTDVRNAEKTFAKFNEGLYLRLSGLGHMYDLDALPKTLGDTAHASIYNAEAKWKSASLFSKSREISREPIGRTPQAKRR